jgi:phosphoribosyl 1,2-cyclic phosphate phosphodiesterase
MRVTVLGCGTSAGVPQIGCTCPVCRSPDPRNKRLRCSILVEAQGRTILVDTGPDLRQQCLAAGVATLDGLLFTHAHADHVHGIDDLRAINNNQMAPVQAHADARVLERIRERFPYAFEGGRASFGWWRPEIAPNPFEGPFRVGGIEVVPFRQKHGRGVSWGFRIGRFAYSTDTDGLDERAFACLRGVDTWLVDALRDRPHPSHAHLDLTLAWIDRVAPSEAFLTHMNHEVDYADWASRLPAGVLPAHDGLVIELPD